ncbi:MAG TPA: asparagine synthase (glutamine-hydrolyzing) [Dissulfurispiraceae bacterium]
MHAAIAAMTDALSHRGPDDRGIWVEESAGIALGHRRLSIIDLSPQGHQPMFSASGRYAIVFNGEIYNYRDIRNGLDGQVTAWHGHSDTEVALAAIESWGLEQAAKKFVGMFAFALWDREEKALHLVRDRLGEKPLYYGWMGDVFLFGSELKSLCAHPAWRGEVNRDALALLLRYSYIPAPYSIYRDFFKLIPGTILSLPAGNITRRDCPVPKAYWSAREVAEAGVASPFPGSEAEAAESLEHMLKNSVRQQMIADVPLGAFLSGGIDSSIVVALMQAQSTQAVKTFTIGFHEEGYNEADYAKAVARHLGTDHTELYVTPEEAMAVIPKMPALYDEPFSDSSQIPTFLVSQLARRHVTVSLSGDGGDELFYGYSRYNKGRSIWAKAGWMPSFSRNALSGVLTAIPVKALDGMFGWTMPLLKDYGRPGSAGDKLRKLSEVLSSDNFEGLYQRLLSHWKTPGAVAINSSEPLTAATDRNRWAELPDVSLRMMYLDMVMYLPDDILVKIDRASMGVSLESRVPFLDHRVVEFAWRVPLSMKTRNNQGKWQGKWLLRQILHKYIPKELVERPKMGFGVPIDKWLRGPLRDWAEALLHEDRLKREGFFNPAPIREKWTEHLSGERNWQYYLWDVLMFQAWKECWLPK